MIKAVIFDMDGTLVDTERLGLKAWQLVAQKMDLDLPESFVKTFIGRTRPAVLDMLAERVGGHEMARRVFDERHDIQVSMVDELETKPGAMEALDALRAAGYRLELATSSRRATAEFNLGRFGILDYFEAITCGEEVVHGKPDPEMYELAARKLGLSADACAVVEDSPNGVRSGFAAGMRVFMVPDVIEPTTEIEQKCYQILPSLFELPAAVEAVA